MIFIIFLILKLTETVDWNWFWVCFPLILPILISILAMGGFLKFFVKAWKEDIF